MKEREERKERAREREGQREGEIKAGEKTLIVMYDLAHMMGG